MICRLHRLAVRSVCGLVLAAVLTVSVDATTLAIIRTGGEIVIAADSLMTLYGRRPQLTCKIRRHGDVVFATAGLVTTSGGVLEFSLGDCEHPARPAPVARAGPPGRGVAEGAAAPDAQAHGTRVPRGVSTHSPDRASRCTSAWPASTTADRRSRYASTSSSAHLTERCGSVSSVARALPAVPVPPRCSGLEKRTK